MSGHRAVFLPVFIIVHNISRYCRWTIFVQTLGRFDIYYVFKVESRLTMIVVVNREVKVGTCLCIIICGLYSLDVLTSISRHSNKALVKVFQHDLLYFELFILRRIFLINLSSLLVTTKHGARPALWNFN